VHKRDVTNSLSISNAVHQISFGFVQKVFAGTMLDFAKIDSQSHSFCGLKALNYSLFNSEFRNKLMQVQLVRLLFLESYFTFCSLFIPNFLFPVADLSL